MFNDRDIPPSRRAYIPIIEDNSGIVFVPGLPRRDGAGGDVILRIGLVRSEGRMPVFFATPKKD